MPVNVRDYNRKHIDYGDDSFLAASFSLSTTAVQVRSTNEIFVRIAIKSMIKKVFILVP